MTSGKVAAAAKEKGIQYVAAPVGGSTVFAESAQLLVLASGPKEAVDALMPAFEAMSRKVAALLQDREVLAEARHWARARAYQFRWEAIARTLATTYEEALTQLRAEAL